MYRIHWVIQLGNKNILRPTIMVKILILYDWMSVLKNVMEQEIDTSPHCIIRLEAMALLL